MKRKKQVWIKKWGDIIAKVDMFIFFDTDTGYTMDGREVNKIGGRWILVENK